MKQSFEFTMKIEDLLFSGWTSDSLGGLVATFLITFCMAVLLEATKSCASMLDGMTGERIRQDGMIGEQIRQDVINDSTQSPVTVTGARKLGLHSSLAAVHLVRLLLGYWLMLSVMSYNAWIFMATFTGSVMGYFLFSLYRKPSKYSSHESRESNDRGESQECGESGSNGGESGSNGGESGSNGSQGDTEGRSEDEVLLTD